MEMGDSAPEKRCGCCTFGVLLGSWPKKTSPNSVPFTNKNEANGRVQTTQCISKRKHAVPDESDVSSRRTGDKMMSGDKTMAGDRIIARPGASNQKVPPMRQQFQHPNQTRQTNKVEKSMVVKGNNPQGGYGQGRKLPYGTTGISGELESMFVEQQRSKANGMFVRASSGNVMLFGHLGNLKQGPNASYGGETLNAQNIPSNVQKQDNVKYIDSGTGNVVRTGGEEKVKPGTLCRAVSTRMDPEELKILGNEDYKNGNFAEALALYDAAISIDPKKASYRSNKSAALTALGRLPEAVFECREAIRIEPHYQRAHTKLATLYLRLGEAEKAIYHNKLAGDEIDPEVVNKAKKVQIHLNKCTEAKKYRDFNTLLKETELAISAGADSAPQIFALRAETMLRLRRHGDADETLMMGPKFSVDDCTKFFGPIGNAHILIIRAQVDTAAGRFDEAVELAQRAARLDGTNKEVNIVLRKTKAMALARANGNNLFRAQKYAEACRAYEDGLDHDPYNSVLLCNRATCRSKLDQFDKAIEDCNIALNVRPSYRKARLRRAECYAKLAKWEACIQDYELLETPEDVEVSQALKNAQSQLNKYKNDDQRVM